MLKEVRIGQILKVKGIDVAGNKLNGTGMILNGIGAEGYKGGGEMSYEFRVGMKFPQIIIYYKEGRKQRLYFLNPEECKTLLYESNHIKKKTKNFNGVEFRLYGKRGGPLVSITMIKARKGPAVRMHYGINGNSESSTLIGRKIKLTN